MVFPPYFPSKLVRKSMLIISQHMSKRSGAAPGPASSSSAEEGGEGDGGFLVIAEAPPKLLEAR